MLMSVCPMKQEESEQIVRAWKQSALYWEKHHDVIRQMFSPVTRAMIDEAGISEGSIVLDVAGGTGEPSLTIAAVAGPNGAVICTDIAAEMVSAAKREAGRRSLINVEFCQCSAEQLPFETATFQAVVCRLGAMFFPDPLAALVELLRVARPDSAVTLAVWRGPEFNPFFRVVSEVMGRYIDSPPQPEDAPGAFRFAEPGLLARLLERAGAAHVRERVLPFLIESAVRLEDFWTIRSELSDTLREKLAMLTPDQLDKVEQEVRESAREYFPKGLMRFSAEVIIVIGEKE
jgi:SAM-dependent methyltransferase